jgi:hypothetical protein
MKSNTGYYILLAVVVVVIGGLMYYNSTKAEHYSNVFFNKDLNSNVLSRPSFNSNLDPRNLSMLSDPNVYGGYIKGGSPQEGQLAETNTISSKAISAPQQVNLKSTQQVQQGVYTAGVNDAAQYTDYSDTAAGPDFAGMAGKSDVKKYMASLSNKNPDTLKYTLPSELLPTPDMRQSLTRDPSDPSNFMYDRTVFAPLKKRNRNEADRIRGDLDIAPIKTGYFDVATVPQVDLVKGYFGYFADTQEMQDLQDISYERTRDMSENNQEGVLKSDNKFTSIMSKMSQDLSKPRLAYAVPPPVSTGADPSIDPWYSEKTGVSKREFEL